VSFQNKKKIDTLVHLVGFTIEIYYDARPYERQVRDTDLNTLQPTFYTFHRVQSELNMWPQIPYIEEMMNVYKILVLKCEGTMPRFQT